MAIAALQPPTAGWDISAEDRYRYGKTSWSGRLQWTTWQSQRLLIDGAHNPGAAQALRQFVDLNSPSVTW